MVDNRVCVAVLANRALTDHGKIPYVVAALFALQWAIKILWEVQAVKHPDFEVEALVSWDKSPKREESQEETLVSREKSLVSWDEILVLCEGGNLLLIVTVDRSDSLIVWLLVFLLVGATAVLCL